MKEVPMEYDEKNFLRLSKKEENKSEM